MIINTQFHEKSFARVLCFILMTDILRRSVTPLDAVTFKKQTYFPSFSHSGGTRVPSADFFF